MADETTAEKSTVKSLMDTAALAHEYENRIAALNLALAEDGVDTESAIWLSDRIEKRQAFLTGVLNGLDVIVDRYLQEREQMKRDARDAALEAHRIQATVGPGAIHTADLRKGRPVRDEPQA